MGKPSAPTPPSPKQTASAQNSTNLTTAVANAFLGNVNQETPYGNLSYDQTGTYQGYDPYTKKDFEVPTFTASQTYTPEGQAILDETLGTQQNLASLANQQSGFLKDYMAQPVDLSSENVSNYVNDHYLDDFTQDWDTQQGKLETRLANQGIGIGSDAYTRAMSDYSDNRSGARDNLYGNMYGLAQQSIMSERNQPINEISAFMSGSQLQNPNFVNAQMPQMATTDVAGLINTNYNQKLANYQQEMNSYQNLMGGLFGLGGNIGSAAIMSDRRRKKNIVPLGKRAGFNIYAFEYKDATDGVGPQIGVMAHEVEETRPDAVMVRSDGFKMVDYGKLWEAA